MSTWYFVRHGQSVANKEGWLSGHVDTELSPLGLEQAHALTPLLADLPLDEAHSSDLQRAHQTGLIAMGSHNLSPVPTAALRERHLGDWEGKRLVSLRKTGAMDTLLSWEGRPPNGESQHDVGRRILRWMADQEPQGRRILFVHGGIIRVITGLIDGLDLEEIGRRKVANATLICKEAHRESLLALLESPAFTRSR
jgi:glucosyl-3-phosphoglycerate phosphatase